MTQVDLNEGLINPLLAEIDQWRDRMIAPPDPVEPGSALCADDASTGFLQTSQVVVNSLHAATDHLHAMSMLLAKARWLHGSAPFTLVRAALECSATAVWLLAPEADEQRLARRLQLAQADNDDRRTVVKAVGGSEAGCDEVKAEVTRLRDAAGLRESTRYNRAAFTHIVELAGVHLGDGPSYLTIWRACSGFAHGRHWATVELARLNPLGPPAAGVVPVEVHVDPRRFESAFGHAVVMTREGWRLYDERRSTPATLAS